MKDNTPTRRMIRDTVLSLIAGCTIVSAEDHAQALSALRAYEAVLSSECTRFAELSDSSPRYRSLTELRKLIRRLEGIEDRQIERTVGNGYQLSGGVSL